MGFLDNVTAAVNKGTAAAGRSADKIKLNARISELSKQRQSLAAQLGASLYDVTRDDADLRCGREALYDGIAHVDAEREECKRQIEAIDAAANAASTAAATFSCVVCGTAMHGDDMFCAGCGAPAEKARGISAGATEGPACPSCGAALKQGDVFCMKCGAKTEAIEPETSERSGIGEAEENENTGIGESERVDTDENGDVRITPGGKE